MDHITTKTKTKTTNRCNYAHCRKKLGFIPNECKCGEVFCNTHKYSFEHSCKFDFCAENKNILANQLVKLVKLKVPEI